MFPLAICYVRVSFSGRKNVTAFSCAGAYKLAVGALDFDSTRAAAAAHQPGRNRGASVDG